MFHVSAFLALFFTSQLFAAGLDSICERSVSAPPIFTEGYAAQKTDSGSFVIQDFEGRTIGKYASQIRGLVKLGTSLWVLTPSSFFELSESGETLAVYDLEGAGNPAWEALSMIKADRRLIISRGQAGVFAFDIDIRKIIWTNTFASGDFGQPSGLAVSGKTLYAASATSYENGFTGIVSLNVETGEILRKTPYDVYRSGVLDVDAKAGMNGEDLVLNNGGWIHVLTKKQLAGTSKVRPRWVAHRIAASGNVHAHFMMLQGEFFVLNGIVRGCGKFSAEVEGKFVLKSQVFDVKL